MKRFKSIYLFTIAMVMAIIVGCVGNDAAFQAELDEDAKAFSDMKCQLLAQVREIKADTTLMDPQAMVDSLKLIWNEKSAPIQDKYKDNPEHIKMFKEKVKAYSAAIEGCEKLEEGTRVKEGKKKEGKKKEGKKVK
ncbi:MAG: hypothetical protein U9R60_00195 [Bacteroidota bacterium]|nr:hypothetical protein [Bacteroidota bacterium]